MEEIFVPINIEHFKDCKISNMGRFLTEKGKYVKPQLRDGCLKIDLSKRKTIMGKQKRIARLQISVPQLVYSHFAQNVPKDKFKVWCIDRNPYNCCIDNLSISMQERSDEQIKKYQKDVMPIVKHILLNSSWKTHEEWGFDIENVIGESYYLIWKYLGNYDIEKSFYLFCKRYVRIACLLEYKNIKKFGLTGIMEWLM